MRRLLVLIAAPVAALALGACGGGSPKASATGTTTSTTTAGGGFNNSAFSACLKQQGITLPAGFGNFRRGARPGAGGTSTPGTGTPDAGPPGDGGGRFGGGPPISIPGVSTEKLQAAFAKCRSSLPNGGRNGFGRFGGANAGAIQAYLSCLRDHGVTVPTATSGSAPASTPGGASPLASVRNDPKFAAANKTCRALLPARGGASTTTTTTPSS